MTRVVAAKIETEYGVDDTENTLYYPIRVTDISEEFNRNEMVEEATDRYITPFVSAGGLAPSGSIDGNFRPGAMHPLLLGVMGMYEDDTGNEKYVYTLGSPRSATVIIQDTVENITEKRIFTGVGFSSMDMSFSVNEFITCSFNWFAQNYAPETALSALSFEGAYAEHEQPSVFWDARLYINDDTENPLLVFKDVSLNIERGLDEEQFVIGSHYRQRLVRTGQTEITGSIQVGEWERDELKRALYGTVDGVNTTNNVLGNLKLVISGSNFKITCPKIIYNTASRSSTGVAEIDTSFDFRVLDTEDAEFTIEALNPTVPTSS